MKLLEILQNINRRNPATPQWAKDKCPIGGCKQVLEPIPSQPGWVACASGHAFDQTGQFRGGKLLNEGIKPTGEI